MPYYQYDNAEALLATDANTLGLDGILVDDVGDDDVENPGVTSTTLAVDRETVQEGVYHGCTKGFPGLYMNLSSISQSDPMIVSSPLVWSGRNLL